MKNIPRDKPKCYLIGPMEDVGDGGCGKEWREYIKPKLEDIGVFVFDPVTLEESKTGLDTKEMHEKILGWKRSGHWDKFMDSMNNIWFGKIGFDDSGNMVHVLGDKDYVELSDFLICHIEEGDKPVGTFYEVAFAMFEKPIYLVTDINKTDLSSSLIWAILHSGGQVFSTYKSLIEYLKGEL